MSYSQGMSNKDPIELVGKTLSILKSLDLIHLSYMSSVSRAKIHVLEDKNRTIFLNTFSTLIDIDSAVVEGFVHFNDVLNHVNRFKLCVLQGGEGILP